MKNFALLGAAGYIAPRHFKAIKDTNNLLIRGNVQILFQLELGMKLKTLQAPYIIIVFLFLKLKLRNQIV